MKRLWKFIPVLVLGFVVILILLPQYPTQSQSSRLIEHVILAVEDDRSDVYPTITSDAALSLDDQTVYLPLVVNSTGETPPPSGDGVYGTVTASGEPADGIILSLWHDMEPITETMTLSDGSYAFTDAPSLNVGESYSAVYMNTITPEFLNFYRTPKLNSYAAGTNVHLSDFDIGDINLISPEDDGIETAPFEFSWNVRPEMTTDSYKLVIHNDTGFDIIYRSELLGYVGAYIINDISEVPMVLDEKYLWEVWVYSPDGGTGISHEWREITFRSEMGN